MIDVIIYDLKIKICVFFSRYIMTWILTRCDDDVGINNMRHCLRICVFFNDLTAMLDFQLMVSLRL